MLELLSTLESVLTCHLSLNIMTFRHVLDKSTTCDRWSHTGVAVSVSEMLSGVAEWFLASTQTAELDEWSLIISQFENLAQPTLTYHQRCFKSYASSPWGQWVNDEFTHRPSLNPRDWLVVSETRECNSHRAVMGLGINYVYNIWIFSLGPFKIHMQREGPILHGQNILLSNL